MEYNWSAAQTGYAQRLRHRRQQPGLRHRHAELLRARRCRRPQCHRGQLVAPGSLSARQLLSQRHDSDSDSDSGEINSSGKSQLLNASPRTTSTAQLENPPRLL